MEMVKIQPTVMTQENFDKGLSPYACAACGEHATKIMEHRIRLAHDSLHNDAYLCSCGEKISVLGSNLTVIPSSAHVLQDNEVKAITWFHATNTYNWLEEVNYDEDRPYVHLGSKEAAMELGKWKYLENTDDDWDLFYLYEVTLNVEAVLADGVLEDNNDWFYSVSDDSHNTLGGDVVRYLNRWESAGSISLLADPRYLTLVRVHDVEIDNYFDILEA